MRVTVDTGRCLGSGMCVLTVDEVFDQREEDGRSVVVRPEPPAELEGAVRRAVELCPAAAIVVSDGDLAGGGGADRSPG